MQFIMYEKSFVEEKEFVKKIKKYRNKQEIY